MLPLHLKKKLRLGSLIWRVRINTKVTQRQGCRLVSSRKPTSEEAIPENPRSYELRFTAFLPPLPSLGQEAVMMFFQMAVEVSSDFQSRRYSYLCNFLPLVPVRALQLFIRADLSPPCSISTADPVSCPADTRSLLLFASPGRCS